MSKVAEIISPVNIEERKKLDIRAGDTVRVWQKIEEKGKTRLQAFEGLVLAVKHGKEAGGTFTVRKVTSGVGVEKIFPIYSPIIDKIEIVKRSKVRRAKLYHIRDKAAKEIKRQMRKIKSLPDMPEVDEQPTLAGQATDDQQQEEESGEVKEGAEPKTEETQTQEEVKTEQTEQKDETESEDKAEEPKAEEQKEEVKK